MKPLKFRNLSKLVPSSLDGVLVEAFLCYFMIFSFSFTIPKHSLPDTYDYVVAKDGSGNFTTIQSAIEACKSFPYQRIKIFIKNGVYHEKVFIPRAADVGRLANGVCGALFRRQCERQRHIAGIVHLQPYR